MGIKTLPLPNLGEFTGYRAKHTIDEPRSSADAGATSSFDGGVDHGIGLSSVHDQLRTADSEHGARRRVEVIKRAVPSGIKGTVDRQQIADRYTNQVLIRLPIPGVEHLAPGTQNHVRVGTFVGDSPDGVGRSDSDRDPGLHA